MTRIYSGFPALKLSFLLHSKMRFPFLSKDVFFHLKNKSLFVNEKKAIFQALLFPAWLCFSLWAQKRQERFFFALPSIFRRRLRRKKSLGVNFNNILREAFSNLFANFLLPKNYKHKLEVQNSCSFRYRNWYLQSITATFYNQISRMKVLTTVLMYFQFVLIYFFDHRGQFPQHVYWQLLYSQLLYFYVTNIYAQLLNCSLNAMCRKKLKTYLLAEKLLFKAMS